MSKPKFKVGDRVWHPFFGWCVVHDYDPSMRTTYAYWCYITLKKYYRWFGWWELFYDEVELPNPPKPEPEIDWSKVPVGTRVLVRDSNRDSWREAMFLSFVPEHEKFTFWVDRDDGNATGWQKCRLASDVEVKEEWLR